MRSSWATLRAFGGDHTSTSLPLGVTTLRPAVGSGRAFRRDPLGFLRGLPNVGDVVRLHLGFTEFHLVTSPTLVRQILVDDDSRFGEGKWTQRGRFVMGDCLITREGAPHAERRRTLQPGFALEETEKHGTEFGHILDRVTRDWRTEQRIDVRAEMGRLMLCMAAHALFDTTLEDTATDVLRDLQILNSALSRPPVPRRSVVTARRRLLALASEMRRGPVVRRLREAGVEGRDLDLEIVSLLIASIDTTPGTLAWLWTRLAYAPGAEAELHQELAREFGGRTPALEDLPRLRQLDRITNEVLRLHPPVHFIDRRALGDAVIGTTPVPAGAYVLLSPLWTQRDPRYWDDPDSFRPERWPRASENESTRRAWFPFGAGPHACIGGLLARREIGFTVAALAQRWRLRPVDAIANVNPVRSQFELVLEART